MLAVFSGLLDWTTFILIAILIIAWNYGIGGLLYVGVWYFAKLPNVSYHRCVLAGVLSIVIGVFVAIPASSYPLISNVIIFIVTLLIIRWILKITLIKAFIAYLPMVAGQLVSLYIVLFILLFPAVNRMHELSRRTVCKTQMRALGRALELYHCAVNVYPHSMDELVKEGYASRKEFKCPSDATEKESSYFYLPPLEMDGAGTFVMCDYKQNHDGEIRIVLKKNGKVEEFSEKAFQAELKHPFNTRFATMLKDK